MTCYTALITPFNKEGKLDEEGFEKILSLQASVDGVVVFGTTGETLTLSLQEKHAMFLQTKRSALPFMAGCGLSSTTQTIDNLGVAADYGAHSALVITPCYNRPTQEGLFQHFKTLAMHSPLPIIIYNIPKRSGVNLNETTLKRLLQFPRITGIKEASGELSQISDIISLKKDHPEFKVYAGDDLWSLPVMALGGDGVISVASNLVPKIIKDLINTCKKGDFFHAQKMHHELIPLFKALSFETNPIPIKAAMEMVGLPAGPPRLPLTPLDQSYLPLLKSIIEPFFKIQS
ncbi:MAG: 4-hydroxy-tetrahydrodipicolinate synthase [Chlamydiales bacterium]